MPLEAEVGEIAQRREARRPARRDAQRVAEHARREAGARIVAEHVVPFTTALVSSITFSNAVDVQRQLHALVRAASAAGALTDFITRVRGRVDAAVTALGQLERAVQTIPTAPAA